MKLVTRNKINKLEHYVGNFSYSEMRYATASALRVNYGFLGHNMIIPIGIVHLEEHIIDEYYEKLESMYENLYGLTNRITIGRRKNKTT